MTTIQSFVNRLKKIGIKVELFGNYPWVYLDKVNDEKVWGKYYSEHAFTVFIIPVLAKNPTRIVNIDIVFKKIREMLCERVREYEVVYPGYFDDEEMILYEDKIPFYGTKEQCKRWQWDYDEYEESIIRKYIS